MRANGWRLVIAALCAFVGFALQKLGVVLGTKANQKPMKPKLRVVK